MKIILSGVMGAMGKTMVDLLEDNEEFEIVAGVDRLANNKFAFPVYDSFEFMEKADLVIDFSSPNAAKSLLDYGLRTNTPLVIATTGYSDEDLLNLEEASKSIPIVYSGNMSIGVNLLTFLVEKLAYSLEGFDIEIVEKHHNKKKDSPSGTAKMLFDSANKGRDMQLKSLVGRSGFYEIRDENEVGISSIRAGNIVGEHEVIFAGTDEVIEVKHIASSKKIFANGALKAASFIVNKKSGLFSMRDVLGLEND